MLGLVRLTETFPQVLIVESVNEVLMGGRVTVFIYGTLDEN